MIIKFEKNLRWSVDFSNFFGSFDIELPSGKISTMLLICVTVLVVVT